MRLFHLITALHSGGAERMLAKCSHEWVGAGHQVHIGYLKPIETARPLFHPQTIFHPFAMTPNGLLAMRKTIRFLKPDIFHTHLGHADLLGHALIPNSYAGSHWLTLHNRDYSINQRINQYYFAAYRSVFRYKKGIQCMAISQAVATHARNVYKLPEAQVHLLYNPLVPPKGSCSKSEARALLNLAQADNVVLVLGRLSDQKDPYLALDTLALLRAMGLKPKLLFVGEGPLQKGLKERAASLDLTAQVRFEGLTNVPGRYLSAADVLFLPSRFEGLGNVIGEAFWCGIPVIATQTEGPLELISHTNTGFLFPIGNAQAGADALTLFFNMTNGDQMEIGNSARLQAQAGNEPFLPISEYASRIISLYASQRQ
jgi:glycosyltransferase involved in cell wall biosynthesis